MKKFFIILISIIVLLIGGVYILLFTPPGNSIVKGIIEKNLNEKIPLTVKITKFKLSPSYLNLNIKFGENSFFNISGDLSIFSQKYNLKYLIKINDLSKFEKLINYKLNGKFYTNGTIKGDKKLLKINGQTDIAKSNSFYKIDLNNYNLSQLFLNFKKLQISDLLNLLNYPKIAKGYLTLNGNIKNIDLKNMKFNGTINILIEDGELISKILNKQYDLNMTKNINLNGIIKTIFNGYNLLTNAIINSSVGKIKLSKTSFNTKTFEINGQYLVYINDLKNLGALLGQNLNGHININGNVKGNKKLLNINGKTDLADSDTKFLVVLKNYSPNELNINSKNMQISSLLYMLNLPEYAKGNIDINGTLKNIDLNNMKFYGNIKTSISNGKIFHKILNKEFNLSLNKDITFNGDILKKFNGNNLILTGNLDTSLANLKIPEILINLKTLKMNGNYEFYIPSLLKLYSLIGTKLRGKVNIKGTISKIKEKFKLTGNSNLFDGKLNFVLDNSNFNMNLKNAKSEKILYMLFYPQMVYSIGNGFFNYNYINEKGKFDFKFINGKLVKKNLTFIPRTVAGLIYVFTGVDLAKELYKNINIDGTINKKVINYNLFVKSKLVEITSKNSIVNLNRNTIKSLLNINLKGLNFKVLIAGNLSKPAIKLNPPPNLKPKLPNLSIKKELKKEKEKIKNLFKSIIPKSFK